MAPREVPLTLCRHAVTWEQIAIYYRWQLVIYNSQRSRLHLDANRGCWGEKRFSAEENLSNSLHRAAHCIARSKQTVITGCIVQIITRFVCQVLGNVSKVQQDEDLLPFPQL